MQQNLAISRLSSSASLSHHFASFSTSRFSRIYKQQPPRSLQQFVVHDFSNVAVNDTANKGELVVEELDEDA